MRREYQFYVYIMQSVSRHVLYIGMSNNLRKRVWQHKHHDLEGFTDDYNATRLVYWERFDDVRNRPRKAVETLAAEEENLVDREDEPRLE